MIDHLHRVLTTAASLILIANLRQAKHREPSIQVVERGSVIQHSESNPTTDCFGNAHQQLHFSGFRIKSNRWPINELA